VKQKHDLEECVKRLDMQLGDIAVVRFTERLTYVEMEGIRSYLAEKFPGINFMVLERGATVEVLHPEEVTT
jgi:hypothetical protein